jgi:hypothetical protein
MMGQKSKERWQDPDFREKMASHAPSGRNAGRFKGITVNSNGERFEGKKQLEEAGYEPSSVYDCINGKRKTHKKLKWWREPL